MISCVIKFLTIFFLILFIYTIDNKKEIVGNVFKSINKSYLELVNSQGKVLSGIIIALFAVSVYLISFAKCCMSDGRSITVRNIIISIVVWVIVLIIMYLVFGIALTLFSKTVENIVKIQDKKLNTKMLCSFLLLTIFVFLSVVAESDIKNNLICLIVGAIICYIWNTKIIINVVKNPKRMIGINNNSAILVINSVFLVLMMIINLYCFVLWSFYKFENAYIYCSCSEKIIRKWDLFYYTIISFSTVGYGDICPNVFASQVVAILISITSILCLIVFINSINSVLGQHDQDGIIRGNS